MTGLAAGFASGYPVFEMRDHPGGICSSYYMRPGSEKRLHAPPKDEEAYRFEVGGGHWIFGGNAAVLRFLRSFVSVRRYERRAGVFFPDRELMVPYPLQHHLGYLGPGVAAQALTELVETRAPRGETMAEWLEAVFGPTLVELFFGPFHELYTAGLWRMVAPQDPYKSPVSLRLAIQGAFAATPPVGYNVTFHYPEQGLDALARRLAAQCEVHYGKEVVQVELQEKEVRFADGSTRPFDVLLSTLPLKKMIALTGLNVPERADPYTSVMVLNIGARRGPRCPSEHWVYVPRSRSGFHRVGFYSNVDPSFLPASRRRDATHVAVYVERAFREREEPSDDILSEYTRNVIDELQQWDWIGEVETVDVTWVEVAYTWSWPGSKWVQTALAMLEEKHVFQAGRYGRWVFQGIAESLAEGLEVGVALRAIDR